MWSCDIVGCGDGKAFHLANVGGKDIFLCDRHYDEHLEYEKKLKKLASLTFSIIKDACQSKDVNMDALKSDVADCPDTIYPLW